jgi:ATP-binding cassette subfamily B protein
MEQTETSASKTSRKFSSFRAFWPWIKPHRRRIVYAFGSILMISAALLSLGQGIAYLVDHGLSRGDSGSLDLAVLICVGITVFLALGSYLRAVLVNKISERIMTDIRKAVFERTLNLSTSWFEQARTGDVMSTIAVDTTLIQTVMSSSLSMSVRNVVVMIGGITMVVLTSPKLTIVILGVIPVVIVPVVILGRRLRAQSKIAQDKLAEISVEAEEALTAIRTIHAFARQNNITERFGKVAEESYRAAIKRVVLRGWMSGIVIFLVFTAISFILWIGGKDLVDGRMSAGDLSAFVFYAALVAASIGALTDVGGELQRAAGAAQRVAILLDQKPEISDPEMPQNLKQGQLDIKFEKVSFSYPSRPDLPTLSEIDLHIMPSERVAIVGPSGAGKSTLLSLMLRLDDPDEGVVRVGGVDARALRIADLRGAMGFVPQDTALFTATIADNIAFGRPGADYESLVDAAKKAFAHDFIMDMPMGYDTGIGEKGVRLSGGQRQRIAIARAILRNPNILLLDEATSSLDAQSEQAVGAALDNLMKNRTTVVIAHRLSTVVSADRIVVLDRGQIVAAGQHDGLLTSSPLYHELASLQFMA